MSAMIVRCVKAYPWTWLGLFLVVTVTVCETRDPRYLKCIHHDNKWKAYSHSVASNKNISISDCIVKCRMPPYTYTAIEPADTSNTLVNCLCGNTSLTNYSAILGAGDTTCQTPCPQDAGETCGYKPTGVAALYASVYKSDCLYGWNGTYCNISVPTTPPPTRISTESTRTSRVTTSLPDGETSASPDTVDSASDSGSLSIQVLLAIAAILSVLVLCSAAFLYVLIKKRSSEKMPSDVPRNAFFVADSPLYEDVEEVAPALPARNYSKDEIPVSPDGSTMVPLSDLVPSTLSRLKSTASTCIYEKVYVNQKLKKPIQIGELGDYISMMKDKKKAFIEEFNSLPAGKIAACTLGEHKDLLKAKNRYKTVLAYDHSRVVLQQENNDALTEYINANYIEGFNNEKEFIATQGPMLTTVEDFWRMVWEQKVKVVVMLTHIEEKGKKKCKKYWPDETGHFGRYEITLTSEEQWPDYCIRTFRLKQGETTRRVRQFHFTAWPDHGVPDHASPLLAFRRNVRQEVGTSSGSIIVHCSAGIGRTGAFVALDIVLQQAEMDGVVDICTCVSMLRTNRVNMVQTVKQYIFIHDALLEAVTLGETTIPCSKFQTEYKSILDTNTPSNTSKLTQQFLMVERLKPKFGKGAFKTAERSENIDKNRDMSILPPEYHRPHLSHVLTTDNYINAVFVKGYRMERAFIVTQKPLEGTKDNFWRMIYEFLCPVVVSIIDPDDAENFQWWPSKDQTEVYGQMAVTNTEERLLETGEEFVFEIKRLGPCSGPDHEVSLFVIHWTVDKSQGPAGLGPTMDLIITYDKILRAQQRSNSEAPVVIQSLYGNSLSGITCAVCSLISMMNTEQQVDVFNVAKQVRLTRPQLLQTQEEFEYLYEVVKYYIQSFSTYANFS